MNTQPVRLRITLAAPRRARPVRRRFLSQFRLRREALLDRYACLVARRDRMESSCASLARRIAALDRAIDALKSIPRRRA